MKLRRFRPICATLPLGARLTAMPAFAVTADAGMSMGIGAGTGVGDPLDAAVEARRLGLDPQPISARDVREVVAEAPAPRLIALQCSLAPATMAPFAEFPVAMGDPAAGSR